jgi:glycosyltransferase involved in cell wall biosynthesis
MPLPRLTFLITDLDLGGTPLVLRDLALGLGGFDVSVISLKALPPVADQSTIPEQLRAAGVAVHSLNIHSPRDFLTAITRLATLLNQQRPAILYSLLIHANALATATVPFLDARPLCIQSIHTLQEHPHWHWPLQGMIAPFADAMIVPAQPILGRIARFGSFQRGQVIPNGIDVSRFADAAPPQNLPWPPGAPVIGYVGRFDPVKNLPLLLEAFATLGAGSSRRLKAGNGQQVHLAMVGYGPQEAALRRLATSLHIAPLVHFVGPTRTPEKWYKSFSLLCLPSSIEGFGLTLIEAMAAGIPVVAMKTPVTAQIIRDKIDGRLVAPSTLASALQEVIANSPPPPHGPTDPQNTSFLRVREHFSVERMVGAHAEFFKNLLAAYH